MLGLGCDEINLCVELSQVWNIFFRWLLKVNTRGCNSENIPKSITHNNQTSVQESLLIVNRFIAESSHGMNLSIKVRFCL